MRLPKSEHTPTPSDKGRENENSCELSFFNIRTSPVSGNNFVLQDISGEVKPGEILAVMGSTGCGKTSLLSALSGRLRLQSGSIRLNGEQLCKRLRRSKIGYVLQHDVFFADLTLKQTLVYTALLRLPDKKYTVKEKLEKVDKIIATLELGACQNNVIGDGYRKRGLSGGEKKRLSIATEIMDDPSVLLIDEPTSGLDSYTAACLMQNLKEYALKESTAVVVAVHQPSSKIFHLFDRLLLLSDGQTAYFGPASCVVSHFEALGLNIAPNYNPADFILEQLKLEKTTLLAGWKSQTDSFQVQISSAKSDISDDFNGNHMSRGSSSESVAATWPTTVFTQIRVLAARNFREARPRMLSKLNWLQTLALAVMAGLVWFKTERSEVALPDLEGFMFFSSTYWMLFALFGALGSFPAERAVVEKERLSGAYRLSAYYLAKMIGEAPLVMVLPSVYLGVAYPLLGGTTSSFLGILFVQILSSLAAQSAGLFFGAALDLSASVTAAAIFTLGAQLLGGYLANNVPSYLRTLSLVYHAFRNMQLLEYSIGMQIMCSENSQFASCSNSTAANPIPIDVYELLNRGNDGGFYIPYWSHTIFLLGFFVFFRILGYVALRKSL
ncbi:ABC transporter G family member 21 isoform X2 [Folsomia candida]|uniref:ABC transporter G family member 21 isoform X2 n=1 Tax=Folsomia candida TaxID=158441 RepID=UPI000B8F2B3D|nr:ABC transporter G family member 21 isoform X2 [Folsomia candida]